MDEIHLIENASPLLKIVADEFPKLKVLEFVQIQKGQLIVATEIAKVSGLSRPTVVKYLEVLELTKALKVSGANHRGPPS